MERCAAKAIVFEPGDGGAAAQLDFVTATQALPKMRRLYALPKAWDAVPTGVEPYPQSGQAPATQNAPVTNADKIVYLAFTSGTTGQPKGVMHSDNTLLANGRAMVRDWQLNEQTII